MNYFRMAVAPVIFVFIALEGRNQSTMGVAHRKPKAQNHGTITRKKLSAHRIQHKIP